MNSGAAVGRRGFPAAAGTTATVVGSSGTGRANVDPELADASGELRGVVRLKGAPVEGEPVVGRLKTHAAATQ